MQVASFVVVSFTAPTGMITAIYIWAILQIVGCYQIYCRPTFGFAYNYVIRYLQHLLVFPCHQFPGHLLQVICHALMYGMGYWGSPSKGMSGH